MRESTETAQGESEPEHAYQAITLRLAQARVTEERPLRQVLKEVTEIAGAALHVQRVSVWFFLDDRRSIRCDYLHEPDRGDVYEGAILHASDFPVYFRELCSCRVVRFVDRDGDPMSEELRQSYLAPLGITAMLDAPIYQSGEVVGIVCHENVARRRHWTDSECDFAAAVGDIMARLYAEAGRLQVENQLGIHQARLAELQQFVELGRLAAGVAHDFNNVLTAVLGYVELVKESAAEEATVHRLANELEAIAGRGRDLTEILLTLGRANAHRPCVVNPTEIIEASLPLLRGEIGRAHV